MAEDKKSPRKTPKGGRKGGTVFPRISLKDAIAYATRLVSKTHTGAQALATIYSGVVNAKAGMGDVRISALRQYGLLEGLNKSGLKATELARKIVAAPPDEAKKLLASACLRPKVFADLFETFHGDTVPRTKFRQRAADLKVHPDQVDDCVACFVESIVVSGLGTVTGDQVSIVSKASLSNGSIALSSDDSKGHEGETQDEVPPAEGDPEIPGEEQAATKNTDVAPFARSKPTVTVNIAIDSTMDTEKLAKQLELLKKFGAI